MTAPAKHGARRIDALLIGASAGGIDALLRILPGLAPDCGFPVVIVLHLPDDRASRLAEVFGQHLALPVRQAEDKAELQAGCVYFAPPGYHLSIENEGCFSLSQEDPVHFSRPAIDVLMASAADAYGAQACGIVLTVAAGAAGGLTAVQDPLEAEIATMPNAAIRLRAPDLVLNLAALRALLASLKGA